MSSKLNVIALISGGKDSLFSILHCLANGHDVVALANLHPAPEHHDGAGDDEDGEGEDLDSFMYQTVGHSIVPLYAQALRLPLYRQPILGSAVNADKDYAVAATAAVAAADLPSSSFSSPSSPTSIQPADADADETESLLPLLRAVLAAHPAANALSTGAILSTYQRTRIESVCLRLGLVPLGYLWQYPSLPPYADAALLRDMAAVRQDARIVKVASGGLDDTFLWADVAEARTVLRLRRAAGRFGGEGAVLGEGGEFETLAVNGPGVLWRGGRIEVDVDGEAVFGEGGSAVVRFRGARVVEREGPGGEDEGGGLGDLRIPDLLDVEFEELGRSLLPDGGDGSPATLGDEAGEGAESAEESLGTTIFANISPSYLQHTTVHGATLTVSNLTSTPTTSSPTSIDPSTQLHSILAQLQSILASHSATPASITSTTLLLRSMCVFTTLNPIYGSLFTAPNPPARVTIACGDTLPSGIDVMLSCSIDLTANPHRRRGLHVQSRSYWAPANIGPYSQAIAVPASAAESGGAEMVHLAGQIPLVPASMQMVCAADVPFAARTATPASQMTTTTPFAIQTLVALQHLWRIGRAMRVRWWVCGVAFTSACRRRADGDRRAHMALAAWKGIHEHLRPGKDAGADADDEDDADAVDVWDLKYGGRGGVGAVLAPETDCRPKLPDYEGVVRREDGEDGEVSGNGAVKAPSLTPPCFVAQVDELPRAADIEWTSLGGLARADVVLRTRRGRKGLRVHETRAAGAEEDVAFFVAGVADEEELWELDEVLLRANSSAAARRTGGEQYTVYAAGPLPRAWLDKARPQIVPCRRVWGEDGRELVAAVTVVSR